MNKLILHNIQLSSNKFFKFVDVYHFGFTVLIPHWQTKTNLFDMLPHLAYDDTYQAAPL